MAYNGHTQTFDTISDLRLQRGEPNAKVNVLGYDDPSDNQGGIFYWDDLSTAPDNQGTIIQPSVGDPTGRWIRQVDDNIYNVKWFGAKGDYIFNVSGTDDTLAIKACIDYLTTIKTEQLHPTIFFPSSIRYLITDTLVIPNGISVVIKSEVVYNGPTNQGALVIGTAGNINSGVNFEIRLRQRFIPDWDIQENRDNNFGIKFINLFNTTDGQVPYVAFFCNNIIFEGNDNAGAGSGGFSYNNITLGSSIDAINHVTLQNVGIVGWVNENKFNSGNFQNSSSTSDRPHSRYGITLKSESTTILPNNNHFYKPCFQLGFSTMPDPGINESLPILILGGNSNTFHDIRSENSGNTMMRTEGTAFDNYVTAGTLFLTDLNNTLEDNTSSKYNFVEDNRRKAATFEDGLIFNSGYLPQKINKYDASTYYIPGVSWTKSSDGNIYPSGTNVTVTDNYVQITNQRPVVFIDTTRTKRFVIRRDINSGFSGRLGVRTYDAAGNIIPASTVDRHAFPAVVWSTVVSSYGSIYHFGNDGGTFTNLTVDDEVHKVAVIFEGGTQPLQLRSFQIYALDAESAGVFSGLSTQFGDFGVSSITPTEVKPAGTIIYNDLSVTNTPTGWQNIDGGTTWVPFGGNVSSVGLAMPSIFSVTGSPVTSIGTLTASLNTQTANTIFAGPATGTAALPTFRALTAADIPASSTNYIQNQFTSAQVANAWVNGTFRVETEIHTPRTLSNTSSAQYDIIGGGALASSNRGGQISLFGGVNPTTPGIIAFYTGTSGGGVQQPERMRIAANGDVGIGGVPTTKLSVTGNANVTGNFTIGSIPALATTGTVFLTHSSGTVNTRTASQVASDIGAVTLTTTQTISGAKTFTANPIIQGAQASVTFNNNSGVQGATLYYNDGTDEFSMTTNAATTNIILNHTNSVQIKNNNTLTNTIFSDGRMSGANAVNNNEFVTLSQANSGFIINGTTNQTADFNITGGGRIGGGLGVGTPIAPTSAKLYVSSNSLPQLRTEYTTGNRMDITTGSTGNTTFDLTGTSPYFRFNQNVGIGIVPTENLHVGGNVKIIGAMIVPVIYTNDPAQILNMFGGSPTAYRGAQIDLHAGNHAMNPGVIIFRTGITTPNIQLERVRITATGDVGIGTPTPATMLHVAGAGTFDGFVDIGGGAANISGLGSATFTSLQVSGNTTFGGNGVPALGKIPTGVDGAGNWTWQDPGAAGIEQWAFVDNIDIMTTNTYTLVPAVAGKRILCTFQVYEKRTATGTGQQDFTYSVGTNASTYNDVTPSAGGNVQDGTEVGLYAGTNVIQTTRSIASTPLVLNITAGAPVLTTATIRWAVRYVLLDI